MNNPTIGEGVTVYSLIDDKYDHRHLYSEIGVPKNTVPQYETLYSETTLTNATTLTTLTNQTTLTTQMRFDNSTPGNVTDEEGQNKVKMIKESTSVAEYEAPYDLPTLDNADNNCYSKLGTTGYSTLEPHIHRATQHHHTPPANDDDYSQLQH